MHPYHQSYDAAHPNGQQWGYALNQQPRPSQPIQQQAQPSIPQQTHQQQTYQQQPRTQTYGHPQHQQLEPTQGYGLTTSNIPQPGPAATPSFDYRSLMRDAPIEGSSNRESSKTITKTTKTIKKVLGGVARQRASEQGEAALSAFDQRVRAFLNDINVCNNTGGWHPVEGGWLAGCGEHIVMDGAIDDFASTGFSPAATLTCHPVNCREDDPAVLVAAEDMYISVHPPAHMQRALRVHRAFMEETSRIPHWVGPTVCECAREFGQKISTSNRGPLLLGLQDETPLEHSTAGCNLFWHDPDGGNAVVALERSKQEMFDEVEYGYDEDDYVPGGFRNPFGWW